MAKLVALGTSVEDEIVVKHVCASLRILHRLNLKGINDGPICVTWEP